MQYLADNEPARFRWLDPAAADAMAGVSLVTDSAGALIGLWKSP